MPLRIIVVLLGEIAGAIGAVVYPYLGLLLILFITLGRPQGDRPNIVMPPSAGGAGVWRGRLEVWDIALKLVVGLQRLGVAAAEPAGSAGESLSPCGLARSFGIAAGDCGSGFPTGLVL